jgi:NADPH:quinone reductase-like Zn-dependent oxidoreductase
MILLELITLIRRSPSFIYALIKQNNVQQFLTTYNSYFRTGLYPSKKPEILGREAEGTIVSVGSGDLHNLKVGDRVVWLGTSAYAEYTCAPASKTHIVPAAISPGVAAAAILQGLTALTLIREACLVQKGDWVLVHAAAGGVGLWLCQLLKAVGARTIGTASTEEKMALAKANGAEEVVNYKEEKDFVGRIKSITGGEGVRVVFDSTGKDQWDNDLEVVKRKGTVVSYGNSVRILFLLTPHLPSRGQTPSLTKSSSRGPSLHLPYLASLLKTLQSSDLLFSTTSTPAQNSSPTLLSSSTS